MASMSRGRVIVNPDPADDLQTRIEKAYKEYMLKEIDPPNIATVNAYLVKDEATVIVDGHEITIIIGPVGRWETWIGKSDGN